MPLHLVSNLLFDTDQETLFQVEEIPSDTVWMSARVYQLVQEKPLPFEVWLFEWCPQSNEETARFIQSFQTLEEAKIFALQLVKSTTST